MRKRGVRVFTLIMVIVALSIAALSYKEIHISFLGADLDRAGSGVLGLTLGLDLQGGSHLKYQANVPVEVVFQSSVETGDLRGVLDALGHTRSTISKKEYNIQGLDIVEVAYTGLREALGDLSPIIAFNSGDIALEVTFAEVPDEEALRSTLAELGHTGAIISSGDENRYTIRALSLVFAGQEKFKTDLEGELAPIESFDIGNDAVQVTFRDPVSDQDLLILLEELGHDRATTTQRFTLLGLFLDEKEQTELESALGTVGSVETFSPGEEVTREIMQSVVDTIQSRVNALGTTEPIIQTLGDDRVIVQLPGAGGSSIDVTFQNVVAALAQINFTLELIGHADSSIEPTTDLNRFIFTTNEPLSEDDLDALAALEESFGPNVGIQGTGDRRVVATFPPPPNVSILSALLDELGLTDFTVQQRPEPDTFVIRTEKALASEDQTRVIEALDNTVTSVTSFEASGGIEEAKNLIGQTAQLVINERSCQDPACAVFVDKEIEGLTGKDLASAFPGRDPVTNEPNVNIQFKSSGTDIFRELTTRLFEIGPLGQIAFFLDNRQISAGPVVSPIVDGNGVITGGFTRESARRLARQLESGRLALPLELIEESSVDALLGADSLRKSLIAGMIGLALVLAFMLIYYRMAGVVAATSLIIYAVIVLAIFKLVPITLTLSGMAGLVLSIGMAVDANILIFERMKEELRTGRTLASSMEVGFRRAWGAIRDGNVSTMITCVILWWFGSRMGAPQVTGFALTLFIGVVVSMFTAIMVSRNMLQILALTPLSRRMSLFTPERRRQPVAVAWGGK